MALTVWTTGFFIGVLTMVCYDLCILTKEQKKNMDNWEEEL